MITMSKADRLLEAFMSGERLTAKQIASRFGVSSARGLVNDLRNRGYAIYLNTTKNSHGDSVRRYRLGTPSRAVVAAGYRVLGASYGLENAA